MNTYGYIRVSSTDQNEDRQLIAMRDASVPNRNIYIDKLSGKDFNRPMYQRMIRRLRKDDLVYIKSIDRLGRNYKDVVEQWQYLTLSFVAENERSNIKRRQKEGIEAAKARGVKFGRPPAIIPDNFTEIYEKWQKKSFWQYKLQPCAASPGARSTRRHVSMGNKRNHLNFLLN